MDRVFDSELKVMEIIWENEPVSTKEISEIAKEKVGWSKNTTYTVVTKLVAKGLLKREDPGFVCSSLVTREQVRRSETRSLAERLFGGSKKALFSALLEDEELSEADIKELKDLINGK